MTDDAAGGAEPVESLDSIGGKAWFHNKPLVYGSVGGLSLMAFVIVWTTARESEEAQTPANDVLTEAPLDPTADKPPSIVNAAGGRRLDDTIVLADEVFAPIDEPDEPDETPPDDDPAEPPAAMADAVADPENETPTMTDRVESGERAGDGLQNEIFDTGAKYTEEEARVISRNRARRQDGEYDAITAPTMAAPSSPLWASYWAQAAAIAAESDSEADGETPAATAEPGGMASGRLLWEGTTIRGTIRRTTRSDSDAPLSAMVVRDVFDALDENIVAIPRGSVLLGVKSGVSWNRVRGFWRAVILPDGRRLEINAALATAEDGGGGLKGKLKTGTMRRVAMGTLAAVINAAGRIGAAEDPKLVQVPTTATPRPENGDGPSTPVDSGAQWIAIESPKTEAARVLGTSVGRMLSTEVEMMADRHIPFVAVKPGAQVLAILKADLLF